VGKRYYKYYKSLIAGVPSFGRNHFLADMFPVSLFGGQFADSFLSENDEKEQSSVYCLLRILASIQQCQWVHFSAFDGPWSTLHFDFFRH